VQFAALVEQLALRGIRHERWVHVPSLLQVFGGTAAQLLMRKELAAGATREQAFVIASVKTNIPVSTLDSWQRRCLRSANLQNAVLHDPRAE
jgi:hypothetical protein